MVSSISTEGGSAFGMQICFVFPGNLGPAIQIGVRLLL